MSGMILRNREILPSRLCTSSSSSSLPLSACSMHSSGWLRTPNKKLPREKEPSKVRDSQFTISNKLSSTSWLDNLMMKTTLWTHMPVSRPPKWAANSPVPPPHSPTSPLKDTLRHNKWHARLRTQSLNLSKPIKLLTTDRITVSVPTTWCISQTRREVASMILRLTMIRNFITLPTSLRATCEELVYDMVLISLDEGYYKKN